MFWIGLGVGILIDGILGYFACALMVIVKQADWISNKRYRELSE